MYIHFRIKITDLISMFIILMRGGGGAKCRAGKRGAARQHCCQKEMDKNISGRRILVEFTAVFEFLKTKFLLLQLLRSITAE